MAKNASCSSLHLPIESSFSVKGALDRHILQTKIYETCTYIDRCVPVYCYPKEAVEMVVQHACEIV